MTELRVRGVTAAHTESVQLQVVNRYEVGRVGPPPAAPVVGGAESLAMGNVRVVLNYYDLISHRDVGAIGVSLSPDPAEARPSLRNANDPTGRHLIEFVLVRFLDSHLDDGFSGTRLLHTGTQRIALLLSQFPFVDFQSVFNILNIFGDGGVGCAVDYRVSIGVHGACFYIFRDI